MRKKSFLYLILLFGNLMFTACNDVVSYADLKEKEKDAINSFLVSNNFVEGPINVISQAEFIAKDSTTDVSKNEFVLLGSTGVYMQIVRKGEGAKMQSGDSKTVLARFLEYNIQSGDTILTNRFSASNVDKFTVSLSGTTFTGSFISGYMYSYYSSSYGTSVPTAWMIPLSYINLGRNTANLAEVRLIVPHDQGTQAASQSVYPTYYEISYEAGL
ncbi:MAG: DUF4827 domain-containing protein [Bacteroidaceae bacterium]|nr:DUF4827 domain-containing protein [Bacteroidaceae bacterium]MBQ7484192.1 DUF4827 domain-containing protein [Bacteroidaceae bacterium]